MVVQRSRALLIRSSHAQGRGFKSRRQHLFHEFRELYDREQTRVQKPQLSVGCDTKSTRDPSGGWQQWMEEQKCHLLKALYQLCWRMFRGTRLEDKIAQLYGSSLSLVYWSTLQVVSYCNCNNLSIIVCNKSYCCEEINTWKERKKVIL